MHNEKVLIWTSLLLGIAFDILFWKKVPGISFAIFTILCLTAGYLLLRSHHIRPAGMSLVLLAPILFFSVMTVIRLEPFTLLLNFALTLFCMALLAMTYRSGRWFVFTFMDYLVNSVFFILNIASFGATQLIHHDSSQTPDMENGKPNKILPIVRGIVIALPILFVFGALFSSSDLIFARKLGNLFAFLSLEKLGEYAFRCAYILIAAYLLAGIFNYPGNLSQNEKLTGKDQPIVTPFLGFTEASIILGSILLLFGAFVLIQFQYFFSGQANISLEGFTYSEYARRGFGELVAVAALSLLIFQVLSVITMRQTTGQKRAFSGLGIGLVALVIIILISSFQRLYLYEAAYAFTRSRAYAHVFIIWLGILLLTVVVLEVLNRQRALATAALIILMGFTVSLNFLNVDAFIAHQNIRFAVNGKDLDTTYLSSLSNDAVPTLVKNYSTMNLTLETQKNIEAALVCHDMNLKARSPDLQNWQSFHFSNWKAVRELDKVKEQVEKYHVQDDNETWPIEMISPGGLEFTCP